MTTRTRRYVDLTTAEVSEALSRDSVLVLPTGAIEPHGPHLPLSTDLVVAEALGRELVDRGAALGHDVWLLPALSYTKSDEHARLPGTMWLGAHTLFETIVDLGRSIAATPARRVLFVNGHGGNSALLEVACRELRRRFDLQTFLYSGGGRPGPTECGFGIHAGFTETSMMLHLRPDLVDMRRAVRAVPESLAEHRYVGFGKPVRFGWLSDDFSASGVIGDPTPANADQGKVFFEDAVSTLVGAIGEIASFDPGRVLRP
ncbi:creatininase family protein [Rhodococcus triatomae]|uniref:Creatinine amidohydrolase n=1 Tax=Rhodococcus triatomae TaxID=300028 RepID=A0A1G8L3G5_9NOCA|nr:creatininase family protein [Rhodococcus triatomae]QNG20498.1 creatininase family protein [Rhodococcus triatomae]QNG23584.1 creatininase family protein [Rhodococcus triatomae]SDI50232.1 creatinine amidohydrolase [Rhodococcus triatomae]